MCTAATYKTKDHYFGRNLDLEYSYHETVTVTPRNYPFHFGKVNDLTCHYAMIGMAYVVENYPLYYDATNEKGLSIAGLYFPGNAHYKQELRGMDNVATFELIPWILGQCGNISEVRVLLEHMNIWNENFSRELPAMPLHWMVSDREETIVLEAVSDGLKIYDNPVGVLTNNPPFDFQMFHLSNYMNVSAGQAENRFSKKIDLKACSKGMGGAGAAWGFILSLPICQSRVYPAEFGFGGFGVGEYQPIFPHPWFSGPAAWLRTVRKSTVRDNGVFFLL